MLKVLSLGAGVQSTALLLMSTKKESSTGLTARSSPTWRGSRRRCTRIWRDWRSRREPRAFTSNGSPRATCAPILCGRTCVGARPTGGARRRCRSMCWGTPTAQR